MDVGLQAGFGAPLAAEFAGIAAHGFAAVRQDVYAVDPDAAPALVAECVGAPVRPLFLIGGGHIERSDGSGDRLEPYELAAMTAGIVEAAQIAGLDAYALEIGNEPDLAVAGYSERPEDFAEAVRQAHFAARAAGFAGAVISGGISNLNGRGFRYLARMLAAGALPDDVVIGMHRYPESHRGPLAPHLPWRSREDEWATLVELTPGRRRACTEFGYHTADVLSDRGVAASVLWDLAFYEARGVELAVVYQLNDGPTASYLDHYGMRYLDGRWKPVAEAVRAVYGTPEH